MSIGDGLILIDKSEGWTSHDVVAKLRGILGTRKIGHAGTLDPMATGLLLLGVNSATKLLTFFVGADKTYEATIRLGASTLTDDRESDFLSVAKPEEVAALTNPSILQAIKSLTGEIEQVPSSVSAIKVNGVRSYQRVRDGEAVELNSRKVTVSKFELLSEPRTAYEYEHRFVDIDVAVDCSSGTYIRALARDLGQKLGVSGHLTALRRTRIGAFTVAQSVTLENISSDASGLTPIEQAAAESFPTRALSDQDEIDLRHGKRLPLGAVLNSERGGDAIAALNENGSLVAVLTQSGNQLKSMVVFQSK